MDLSSLLAQHPQLVKWAAIIGAAYVGLSALFNAALVGLKAAGKGDSKAAAFCAHALFWLANAHQAWEKYKGFFLPKVGPAAVVAIAAAALLLSPAPARAQDDGPGGCIGVAQLHCGTMASFISGSPINGQVSFQPAAGPSLDYHFLKWDLGLALLSGGLIKTNGQTAFFGTLTPFFCAGSAFGVLHGACMGPEFDLFGSQGGAFKGWTWAQNFRIGISASSDLLNLLQLGPKVAPSP